MNRRNVAFVALAGSLALASCVKGERREATFTKTWPAAGIHRINVREVDGTINVVAGKPDEIALVAHVESRGIRPTKEENQGYFATKVEGDTLVIGREGSHVHVRVLFFSMRDLKVDYDLRVPPATALALKTVNGHISTIGIDGESEVTTVNGGIDVESGGGSELSAKSVNGYVRARFLREFQGAQLKTVNGSVRATLPPTASFACDLSQVNGDFEASFPLSIHSHPGNRRVSGEVNGGRYPLRITTVNGDIQVQTNAPVPPVPATPAAAPLAPAAPIAPAPPPVPLSSPVS